MPRRLLVLGSLIVGLASGLIYGWIINPVNFVDTTPPALRADYRADYVLMVAESFHAQHDPDTARQQLAVLGSQPPADICSEALQTASAAGYAQADLGLMQDLMRAVQGPAPANTPATGTP